jgi:ElaB/YqjD/DUF883 family membrane-anchored ribosome-binding protein
MWFLRRRASKSGEEAKEALAEAEQALQEVKARGQAISKMANDARNIRERNHFAEQLEDIIVIRRRPLHR